MGLKDAVKKVKEKVQGMTAQPYIEIDMAAGEDMTSYEGQQDAKKPEEAHEGNQAENSAQETEKGQEGASGEATGALQKWLAKFPEEVREQRAKVLEEFCKEKEVEIEKLADELLKAAEQIKNAWDYAVNNIICPAIEYLIECLQEDFCETAKAEMSNNERRRRGMPMVRRQAHIRNARNGRKRRK